MNEENKSEVYTDSSAHYVGIATALLFTCVFALNAIAY
jgi:hypothetical protein